MTTRRTIAACGAERGFALLIVLWSLVPMALLFLTLASNARSQSQSAADLRSAAVLEAAADGAINTAIFELLSSGGGRLPARTIRMPGAVVALDFVGASGLVNPNTVSPLLLRALLDRLGADDAVARRVAGAVVDWRTQGQLPSPDGAKSPQYRAAGRDYGPPGSPFESVDEMGLVLGMTPQMLRTVAPYLSIYAYGDPDPQNAPPPVRQALSDLGVLHSAGPLKTQVFQITATASGAGGDRVRRRAIIRLGPSPNGRPWRVLSWDTVFNE